MHQVLQHAREAAVDRSLPKQEPTALQPHSTSLDADLAEAAKVSHAGTDVP